MNPANLFVRCILSVLATMVACGSSLVASPRASLAASVPTWKLEPLARAYGYVRYFHPTTAVQQTDWDQFLIRAVENVKDVSDPQELSDRLAWLFAPVGFNLRFSYDRVPSTMNPCLSPLEDHLIMQHRGVALDATPSPDPNYPLYVSKQVLVQSGLAQDGVFDDVLPCGTAITTSLGGGLSLALPLSVPSRFDVTLSESLDDQVVRSVESVAPQDVRAIDVIQSWAVLQHFYPYFDVVDVDWNVALGEALGQAGAASSDFEHFMNMKTFSAKLHDGHAFVRSAANHAGQQGGLPMIVDMIQGQPTVVGLRTAEGQLGDVVLSVDGVDAAKLVDEARAHVSGSPQWKTHYGLRGAGGFGWGARDSVARIEALRGGEHVTYSAARSYSASRSEFVREVLFEIAPRIFYVNLDLAEIDTIMARIGELAAADGVIFDLRGYPRGNHEVIHHLIDSPVRSAYFDVPKFLRPDQEARILTRQDENRWLMEPRAPRLGGKIVFITGGSAISYAESFMGIIEAYGLAEIVAADNTAGANGNMNILRTLGGIEVCFTGMRVTKHDGTVHHNVGIAPTVRVTRTLDGAKAGQDELLDRALEIIRSR